MAAVPGAAGKRRMVEGTSGLGASSAMSSPSSRFDRWAARETSEQVIIG